MEEIIRVNQVSREQNLIYVHIYVTYVDDVALIARNSQEFKKLLKE